jgi:hypothetical protein
MLIIETESGSFMDTLCADMMVLIFLWNVFTRWWIHACISHLIILKFIHIPFTFSFFFRLLYLMVYTFNWLNVVLRLVAATVFKYVILISHLDVGLHIVVFLMIKLRLLINFLNIIFVLFLLIVLNSLMWRFPYFLMQTMLLFKQILILILLENLLIIWIKISDIVIFSILNIVIHLSIHLINFILMNSLHFSDFLMIFLKLLAWILILFHLGIILLSRVHMTWKC